MSRPYRHGRNYYFKYKDQDGLWKERATGTRHYQQAVMLRSDFLRELEEGCLPNERGRWTLIASVTDWLEGRRLRVARGTYNSDCTITRNLLRVFGQETKLEKIASIQQIRRYEEVRLSQGACAKTVNNEVQDLAAILREANLWRRVEHDYKPLRVPKSDVGAALTREEAHRLLQAALAASDDAVAPYAAALSYASGLRSIEIRQMKLGAIRLDCDNPYLYVTRDSTKTDSGARYVALDKIACWALEKLIARCHRAGGTRSEHYLLPTMRQKHTRTTDPLRGASGFDPMHPQSSWQGEWDRLRRAINLEHRRFHDLRHSYISRAAEAGVPLAVTQAQVGHMSIQMVELYTHVCHAAIHNAAKQIEQKSSDLLARLGLLTQVFPEDDCAKRNN